MSLYQYNGNSVVKEARFIKNGTGGVRAYLRADPSTSLEALNAAATSLDKAGYTFSPQQHQGNPVLEVRGFGKEEDLIGQLKKSSLIDGAPKHTDQRQDRASLGDWLKKRLLLISTFLYIVGDVSFIVYEHMEAKKKKEKEGGVAIGEEKHSQGMLDRVMERVAGFGYLAGSLTSMTSILAKLDQSELEVRTASRSFVKAAQEAGFEFSDDDAIVMATKENPNEKHNRFRDTFTKYPAELMNVCFAAAGTGIAYNAFRKGQQLRKDERDDPSLKDSNTHQYRKMVSGMDIALGTGTAVSGIGASVVKEKKRDPNQPRKTGIEGVKEWFQERPMRIASIGYLLSTIIHLASSIMERTAIKKDNARLPKDKQEEIGSTSFRLVFVVTNLIAEVIMGFASKGHGEGVKSDETVDTTVCAKVVQKLNKYPADQREEMFEKAVLLLEKSLGTPRSLLSKIMREQQNEQDNNPWALAMLSPNMNRAAQPAEQPAEMNGKEPVSLAERQGKKFDEAAGWKQFVREPVAAAAVASPSI